MNKKKKLVIGAIVGIFALTVIVLVAFNLGKNQNPVVNKAETVKNSDNTVQSKDVKADEFYVTQDGNAKYNIVSDSKSENGTIEYDLVTNTFTASLGDITITANVIKDIEELLKTMPNDDESLEELKTKKLVGYTLNFNDSAKYDGEPLAIVANSPQDKSTDDAIYTMMIPLTPEPQPINVVSIHNFDLTKFENDEIDKYVDSESPDEFDKTLANQDKNGYVFKAKYKKEYSKKEFKDFDKLTYALTYAIFDTFLYNNENTLDLVGGLTESTLESSEDNTLLATTPVYFNGQGQQPSDLSYLVNNGGTQFNVYSQFAKTIEYNVPQGHPINPIYFKVNGSADYANAKETALTSPDFGMDSKNYDVLKTYLIIEEPTDHDYLFVVTKKDNDIIVTLHFFKPDSPVTEQNRFDTALLTLTPKNQEQVVESQDFVKMLNPEESTDKFYLEFAVNKLMANNQATGTETTNTFVNIFSDGNYAYKSSLWLTDLQHYKAYMMLMMWDKTAFPTT